MGLRRDGGEGFTVGLPLTGFLPINDDGLDVGSRDTFLFMGVPIADDLADGMRVGRIVEKGRTLLLTDGFTDEVFKRGKLDGLVVAPIFR